MFFFGFSGPFALHFEHPASQKNRDADMNNPNFYQCIDDDFDEKKVDHLYDEIKQKDGVNPGKAKFNLWKGTSYNLFFV